MRRILTVAVLLSSYLMVLSAFPRPAGAQAADSAALLFAAPWYGSYVCNQGLTRLRLTLSAIPGSRDRIGAEFAFSADPDNPSVPTGSFLMTGVFRPADQSLTLKQERWLDQPADPSYRMVDLEGRVSVGKDQAVIRGRVPNFGCEDFAVWQFFTVAPPER